MFILSFLSLLGFENVSAPRRGRFGFTQSRKSVVSVATIASVAERGDEDEDDDLDDDELESLPETDRQTDTEAGRTPSPAGHNRQSAASSVLEGESEMDDNAR